MTTLANAKEIMDAQTDLVREAHRTLINECLREFGESLSKEFETITLQTFSVGIKLTYSDIEKRVDSYIDYKSKQKKDETSTNP